MGETPNLGMLISIADQHACALEDLLDEIRQAVESFDQKRVATKAWEAAKLVNSSTDSLQEIRKEGMYA